jgi:type I restriction enzyme, S subunit
MNNWIVTPLEQLADISSGGTPSRAIDDFWGGDIPWATPSDITKCKTNYLYNTQDSITWKGLSSSSAKLLPAGTLLFTSRATIGEVRIATKQISTNQGFKNLIAKDCIDADFLFYQVINLKNEFVKYAAGSTFLEINRKDTGRILIPHPVDKNKQEKISHVLKTIDRTITHTEALIEKYQQIKAGLMHDLFTRGIGADGKLRPPRDKAPEMYRESSIGWIPKEWQLKSCQDIFIIDSGITLGAHRRPKNNPRPYLRVANVFKERITLDDVACLEASDVENIKYGLNIDDLLLVEGHANIQQIGRCGLVDDNAKGMLFQNHLFRLRAVAVFPYFGMYLLNSHVARKYWETNCSTSSGLNTINRKMLGKMSFGIPSSGEQLEIEKKLRSISEFIANESNHLKKILDKKSGLMHDLLTGKVRVNSEEIT